MRRNEVDLYSQPVRNVYTNPQFETASGNGVIRTNMCTNPAMVATSGLATTRVNYAPNPSFETGTTGFAVNAGNGGVVATSRPTTGGFTGTAFTRATWTTGTSDVSGYLEITSLSGAGTGITAGSVYTVSAYIRTSFATSAYLRGNWWNGTASTGTSQGATVQVPANVWTRVSVIGVTAPTGTTGVWLDWFFTTAIPTNASVDIDAVLVEQTPLLLPYFDGSTPANYRTNLALDPGMEGSGMANWINNGPGTVAVSTAQKYTGNQSLRVVPGQENWGYWSGISTVSPGRTYTFSIYVYSDAAQTLCLTNYNTPVLGPSVDVPANTWTRLSLTQTIPANATNVWISVRNPDRVTMATPFYMDAFMVEESSTLGTYFDGSSAPSNGYTYSWTGAANASTAVARLTGATYGWNGTVNNSVNTERLPQVQGWASQWYGSTGGSGWTAQMSGTGVTGGYSLRKTWTTANTGNSLDVGVMFSRSVVAGTLYVASIWQRASVATNLTLYIAWKDAGGVTIGSVTSTSNGVASPADTWVQGSVSATAPTGAVTAQFIFGPYSAGGAGSPMPAGSYLEWSNCLIEPYHSVMLSYFDGSTPAAGDFTYNWTGGANGSSSEQRGAGLPGVTSGNSMAIQSTDWAGSSSKSLRIYPNTQYNTSSAIMLSGSQLERGKTYTAIATRRLTAPLTGTLSAYAGAIILVQTGIGTFYSNFISNVAGVGVAKLVFKIVDDGSSWTLRLGHGGSAGSGDVWWDNFMIVEGDYSGDFINPAQNVLAKWDGTAHASTSVGYSPQLFDIAGKPILDYSAPGTYTLDDSFGNTEGRTFYTVIDNLGENFGGVSPIIQYGGVLNDVNPNTYIQLRQDANSQTDGLNSFFARRTGASGANALIKVGRHVGSWGITSAGKIFMQADGGNRMVDTATMDILHKTLLINSDQPLNKHLRTIMYRGEHDDATRLAVSRYLGNKYGAAVA